MTEIEKLNKEKTDLLDKIKTKESEIELDLSLVKSKQSLIKSYKKQLTLLDSAITTISANA